MVTKDFNITDTANFNLQTGLQNLQVALRSGSQSVFYCYFAVVDPTGFISSAVEPFAPLTIGWNLLYSLGYLYTDSVNVYNQTLNQTTPDYGIIGDSIGDALMRPFYSHYIDRFT
jgi:hypothetical protein